VPDRLRLDLPGLDHPTPTADPPTTSCTHAKPARRPRPTRRTPDYLRVRHHRQPTSPSPRRRSAGFLKWTDDQPPPTPTRRRLPTAAASPTGPPGERSTNPAARDPGYVQDQRRTSPRSPTTGRFLATSYTHDGVGRVLHRSSCRRPTHRPQHQPRLQQRVRVVKQTDPTVTNRVTGPSQKKKKAKKQNGRSPPRPTTAYGQ